MGPMGRGGSRQGMGELHGDPAAAEDADPLVPLSHQEFLGVQTYCRHVAGDLMILIVRMTSTIACMHALCSLRQHTVYFFLMSVPGVTLGDTPHVPMAKQKHMQQRFIGNFICEKHRMVQAWLRVYQMLLVPGWYVCFLQAVTMCDDDAPDG